MKPKASENKAKEIKTNVKRQKILAALGEIALENDQLNLRIQQNVRAANGLKAQLAKLQGTSNGQE